VGEQVGRVPRIAGSLAAGITFTLLGRLVPYPTTVATTAPARLLWRIVLPYWPPAFGLGPLQIVTTSFTIASWSLVAFAIATAWTSRRRAPVERAAAWRVLIALGIGVSIPTLLLGVALTIHFLAVMRTDRHGGFYVFLMAALLMGAGALVSAVTGAIAFVTRSRSKQA
jgi:hypothetical protein